MRKIEPVINFYFSEEERRKAVDIDLKEFVVCNIPMIAVLIEFRNKEITADMELINLEQKEATPYIELVKKTVELYRESLV